MSEQNHQPSPQEAFGQMMIGAWVGQMIYAAATLDIAGHLARGPKTPAQLAPLTGTLEQPLYRLLRGLASLGVFAEDEHGRFSNTPLSDCLRDDVPGSQRAMSMLCGEELYNSWAKIIDGLKTGQPQFDKVYGKPIFNWFSDHPDRAKNFDRAMVGAHGRENASVADSYDFTPFKSLTDVGGGNGSLITPVLQKFPHLQGVVFDLPNVVDRTSGILAESGLSTRCKTIPGSFFDMVPPGSDCYMMRHIIHDWNDEQCHTILKNTHSAMPVSGRLLVIESVIEKGNAPSFGKLLDLNMLLVPGGMERTESQFKTLLAKAGFTITRIIPTTTEVSIIEAKKA